MDKKINIKDFPSVDGSSLVPTRLLQKLVDVYNQSISDNDTQYATSIDKAYEDMRSGKAKTYTDEDFFQILESENL